MSKLLPPVVLTSLIRRISAVLLTCLLLTSATAHAQLIVDSALIANDMGIRGTVVGSGGESLQDIRVTLYRSINPGADYFEVGSANTDNAGEFSFAVPDPGDYTLFFNDVEDEYLDEYYGNKATLETADLITIGLEEVYTTTVELRPVPFITGTVMNGQGMPVVGVWVEAGPGISAITDEQGLYKLEKLQPDLYKLHFHKPGYIVAEYYQDQSSLDEADAIDLRNVDFVVANATVSHYGYFSGYVTGLDGEPLPQIRVAAYSKQDDEWALVSNQIVFTDETGYYQVVGLPGVEHRIEFHNNYSVYVVPYATEFYPNVHTIKEGQSFTVPVESMISNINAVMRLENEVEAAFVAMPVTGTLPLTVTFSDHSLGDVLSQMWDFGDSVTSSEISPTHTYTEAGVYTVTLTATGAENSHTLTKTTYITVAGTPLADLAIDLGGVGNSDVPAMVGQTLHFSATSGGSNVEYLWDFGDESVNAATTAIGQFVQHQYQNSGTYIVTLTARSGGSEVTTTIEVLVKHGLMIPKLERGEDE